MGPHIHALSSHIYIYIYMQGIACTFAAYHAVKRQANSLNLLHGTNSLKQSELLQLQEVFLETFWVESLDVGLQCRHIRLTPLAIMPPFAGNIQSVADASIMVPNWVESSVAFLTAGNIQSVADASIIT